MVHQQNACKVTQGNGWLRTSSSNLSAWSILRGNPSTRKRPLPSSQPKPDFDWSAACIAFSRSLTVTSMGTISPSRMHVRIRRPYSEFGRSCSARRRSPAERWEKLNSSTRTPHCVPLPRRGYVIDDELELTWSVWGWIEETHRLLGRQARISPSPSLSRIWASS
jgi:hypothetical protein